MMEKLRKTPKKQAVIEPVSTNPFELMSVDQWRYVTARIENPEMNIEEAANHIGIAPKTVYGWPKYVNEALELAVKDLHAAVIKQRKQSLLKAMRVKISGLDSKDENIRQKVATEILESELGKATQPIGGANGGAIPLKVIVEYADYNPKTTASDPSAEDNS